MENEHQLFEALSFSISEPDFSRMSLNIKYSTTKSQFNLPEPLFLPYSVYVVYLEKTSPNHCPVKMIQKIPYKLLAVSHDRKYPFN